MPVNNVEDSRLLAETVVEAMKQKKGHDITSLDFEKLPNAITKFFVICHGTSKTQVDAIADAIKEQVRNEIGLKPWHSEGFENAEWILLDYVDVVAHVFQKENRSFYQLEDLWADAKIEKYEDK